MQAHASSTHCQLSNQYVQVPISWPASRKAAPMCVCDAWAPQQVQGSLATYITHGLLSCQAHGYALPGPSSAAVNLSGLHELVLH